MAHIVVDQRFGPQLRELRQARGLSLRGLADQVPCSHVHIHRLERGLDRPSVELAQRLDRLLAAGGSLEELVGPSPQGAAGRWDPRAETFARGDAEALAAALVAELPTAENALQLAHVWMVAEPPQLYEVRAGRRISIGTVARIEQRVHQLRLLDDHVGGAESHTMVAAELAACAHLLRSASYSEEIERRLLVSVGELAQLAGWVASDAGRHLEAQRLYLAGVRAAHAAGDIAGAANNLSSLAYQLVNVGDPRDAVVLARTASCRAAGAATATTRALLLERTAWAHARAGEARACDRALGEVEDAYSARKADDDPPWVYWLDQDEIEVMAGRCWTELRRPLRAVPVLRRATAGYGADRSREAALYLSWLAESLLQAGEVEEAATVALRVLDLSRQSHSSRASERVARLGALFRPHRGVAEADTFRDAVT